MSKIALIMAAGLGTRMRPLTLETPKPLIKVFGTPMIETVIQALASQVTRFYVVVGYKAEQFEYLTKKYPNLTLIKNEEYDQKNNISSINAAAHILEQDCFICEADLYIKDGAVFDRPLTQSCYFGKFVEGQSLDWVFETKEGKITRVCKGGKDLYNMVGVSFWKKPHAMIIRDAVRQAYSQSGHGQYYWDEIVDQNLYKIDAVIQPVEDGQIVEIDTVEELAQLTGRGKC